MTRSRLTFPARRTLTLVGLAFIGVVAVVPPAHAATVANLQATFRDGQTFVTWDNLPGTGWTYHIYSAWEQFKDASQLDAAVELAQVGDNSAVDERISAITGQTLTFRIAANEPPLPVTRGLFVTTPLTGQVLHYAVIADRPGQVADRTLIVGRNSTADAVFEQAQKPRPVWQRTLLHPAGEDYVLWTSSTSTQVFPAMCNVSGRPFHVGVIKGQRNGALILQGHGRGGNFFNSLIGTGTPGEWVLSIDDYLPTGDFSSFYFGYEVNYDLDQAYNFPRTDGGLIVDFTEQRVMYLLDWADREMPHDPNRVYAMGSSMGGSFAFFLAWHHPEKLAAALAVIPKICLGYSQDIYPGLRESLDRMWGSPDIDLPTTAGERVFQWMDGREQARLERHRGSAPIVGFCGINDVSVGWAEKVAYFRAIEKQKSGGTWFWDERGHYTPQEATAWFPMMASSQLYKYRADRSYPAFSNCSVNSNFGNGDALTADPIGNINGAMDWDETALDETEVHWGTTLRARALVTADGTLGAPESLVVDVTPRRLQRFIIAEHVSYRYEVRRVDDGALTQSGFATPDPDAVLTLPQIKVYRSGVRLSVFPNSTTGVNPGSPARSQPHVSLSRNPVQVKASLRIEWPGVGEAFVELFDPQGRRVRTEFQGIAKGVTERTFNTAGLAPGLYLVSARQGASHMTRRVTVIR